MRDDETEERIRETVCVFVCAWASTLHQDENAIPKSNVKKHGK